jgi:hypothetical protein
LMQQISIHRLSWPKKECILSREHANFEFSLHDRATTSLKSGMTGW